MARARRIWRGKAADPADGPQFFSVPCPQGHPVRGARTDGYQALRCPACGLGVFVLPRSHLPEPKAPSTLRPRRRRPAEPRQSEDVPIPLQEAPPQDAVEEVIWIDEEGAAGGESSFQSQVSPPPQISDDEIPPEYLGVDAEADEVEVSGPARVEASPARSARAARPRDQARDRPAAPPRPRPDPTPAPAPAAPPSGYIAVEESEPGFFARHRVMVVLTGVAALVALTVGYRLWLQRWEDLPQVAEVNWTEGQEAFEDGQFDAAKQKLARAAEAFAKLGIDDERRGMSRQMADEAAILADLCTKQPSELITEAARFSPPEAWPERFKTIYAGQSIIVDSKVESLPRGEAGRYELALRFYVGRGPQPSRVGRINLEGFTLLDSVSPAVGQAVLFGARLESLKLEGNEWQLRLQTGSGVLMTHTKVLEQTGWDPKQSAGFSDEPVVIGVEP